MTSLSFLVTPENRHCEEYSLSFSFISFHFFLQPESHGVIHPFLLWCQCFLGTQCGNACQSLRQQTRTGDSPSNLARVFLREHFSQNQLQIQQS